MLITGDGGPPPACAARRAPAPRLRVRGPTTGSDPTTRTPRTAVPLDRPPHSAAPPGSQPRALAVLFPCTFCGRRIGVPAELIGRQARCPRCRQGILVPPTAVPNGVVPEVIRPPDRVRPAVPPPPPARPDRPAAPAVPAPA